MAETLPLEQLENKVDSLYEAIVIIARRARQINELQKRLIDKETEANASDNDLDEVLLDSDYLDRQYLKLPKPTTLALQEMLDDRLNFEYIGKNK
ncbi:DNA-directed RNA polymerase subunit omega [candidate division KSB1 bacterium]|nr:DNA-directed RNA polymerase subunit omega [candidate division KSB1 bacterium]